jgi:hypothetical protein
MQNHLQCNHNLLLHSLSEWGSPPEAALHLNQVCHLHPSTCRFSDVCPEFLQLSNSNWLSTSSTPLVASTWFHKIHSNILTELGTFFPTNYFSICLKTDSGIQKMKAVHSSKCQNKPFLYAMKPPKKAIIIIITIIITGKGLQIWNSKWWL